MTADLSSSSAALPAPLNGYTMTNQFLNQSGLTANISFTRPMTASSSDSMTLDHTITYVAYLNWGVFDSANSTNTTYTWGSKNEEDT